MINPRSLYYKRQAINAVWQNLCELWESYETRKDSEGFFFNFK